MGLRDILDHLLRRDIKTPEPKKQEGEGGTSQKTEGLRFYLRYFFHDRAALAAMVIIVLFYVWAVMEGIMQQLASIYHKPVYGYMLLPSNPFILDFTHKLLPPSLSSVAYLFGTNFNGQSILSQILYAAPRDAMTPIVIVGSAILIGMILGTAAGYIGGWTDELIMRITDTFLAIPGLVLALTVSVLLGAGFTSLVYSLVIVWWPTYARFFRAQALTLRNKGYVESAKLSGMSSFRILIRHIIPNSVDPVIAYATLDLGTVILTYSTLAFLGIGLTIGYPEWGYMSSDGLSFFPIDWWWSIIPGIVIGVIVVSFTLVGDRIQDIVSGRMTY